MAKNERRFSIDSGNKKCYVISLLKMALYFDVGQEMANLHPPIFSPDFDQILEKRHALLRSKCQEHYEKRKKEIDARMVPKHFMIAHHFDTSSLNREYIEDMDLVIALIGRTSGGIYIPDRKIDLESYPFNEDICFMEEEFNEK